MVDLSVPQSDANTGSSVSVGVKCDLRHQRRVVQNAFYKSMKRFRRTQGFVRSNGGASSASSVGILNLQGKEVRKPAFVKSKGGWKKGKGKGTLGNGGVKTSSIEDKRKSKNWY